MGGGDLYDHVMNMRMSTLIMNKAIIWVSSMRKVAKVYVPNLVTHLNQIPIFEWYVGWCGSENEYQKKNVFKRNWTASSKYDKHSKLNHSHIIIWRGGLYDHLMSMRFFTLIMKKKIPMSSENYDESGYNLNFGFVDHLVLITCFIS